jgi:hypothetical protein
MTIYEVPVLAAATVRSAASTPLGFRAIADFTSGPAGGTG